MKKKFKLFGKTYEKTEVLTAAGFMLPAVVLGIIFVMLPIVLSLMFAFTDANMLRLDKINYVGLKNFIQLFSKDELALTSLKNSLFFTVCVVPLHFSISLGLA